jgi:DNA-binding CsgD family transcriptional regulator
LLHGIKEVAKLIDHFKKAWYLEGTLENGKSWIIPIDRSPFTIGRNKECNLALNSKNVSRKHAEIYLNGENLMLSDFKSTNGTFLNNVRIKEDQKLKSEDSIQFADIYFKIITKDSNILDVSSGTFYIEGPQRSDNFAQFYDLTRREEEILLYLLQGKSTKVIADKLFISSGTAKNHILNIYKKTDTHSKFELLTLYNSYNKKK